MKIETKNLTKLIHGTKVIDNINLSLVSGNVYGLSGYNGCGKTMLMRLISGLIIPTSGMVTYDDKILGKDIDFPESLGLLIENPSFLNSYSGFQNLNILASINSKINSDMVLESLDRVGLKDNADKKYKKYSLGMKQRLGIAAAIMEKPDVIILDEPTNALDDEGVNTIKSIINKEKERGALIIITCHDKQILSDLSDVIYKIEKGKIIGEEKRNEKN